MSITVVPVPGGRILRHQIQKLVPRITNVSFPEVNVWKDNSALSTTPNTKVGPTYNKRLISGGEYVER